MDKRGRRLFKPVEEAPARQSNLLDIEGGEEVDALIGSTLRQARERLGYDLQQVSDALRIRRTHLEALEEGRYGDLPGATYAIGFFRSYADFLGLDAEEIVDRFKSQSRDLVKEQKLDFPSPTSEGRMPKGWLVVVVILLAALAYAGWSYYETDGARDAGVISDVPDDLATVATETPDAGDHPPEEMTGLVEEADQLAASGAPGAVSTPEIEGPETPTAPPSDGAGAGMSEPTPADAVSDGAAEAALVSEGSSLVPEETGAGTESGGVAAPEAPANVEITSAPGSEAGSETVGETPGEAVVEAASEGTPEPAPTPAPESGSAAVPGTGIEVSDLPPPAGESAPRAPQTYGQPGGRIVITAESDAWVQVVRADGELLLTRILRAGDEFHAPDEPGLLLTTGNAGALAIRVDGQPTPRLGAAGIVRRDVKLDAEALLSQTPLPE